MLGGRAWHPETGQGASSAQACLPASPRAPLQSLVTAMYQQIREEAKRDAKAWNNPGGWVWGRSS